MRPLQNSKGTTLVELMVSITLLAILSLAATTLIAPCVKAYVTVQQQTRAQTLADALVENLRLELETRDAAQIAEIRTKLTEAVVSDAVDKNLEFNKATLQALTEKSKVDVLVVARIYALDETMVNGWGFRFDNDTYMRVIAFADLYVYKKDGDKFLKRRVRENGVHELGNYEKPEETIKWQLSKLVNTMENKPIIGS